MKIYIASSWRNVHQPYLVQLLRDAGHEVYDFRHPDPDSGGNAFSKVDFGWQNWTTEEFLAVLEQPAVRETFQKHVAAILYCDAVVLLAPCGASAHLEFGLAAGWGKLTYALIMAPTRPELMLLAARRIFTHAEELVEELILAEQRKKDVNPLEIGVPPWWLSSDDFARYSAARDNGIGKGLLDDALRMAADFDYQKNFKG